MCRVEWDPNGSPETFGVVPGTLRVVLYDPRPGLEPPRSLTVGRRERGAGPVVHFARYEFPIWPVSLDGCKRRLSGPGLPSSSESRMSGPSRSHHSSTWFEPSTGPPTSEESGRRSRLGRDETGPDPPWCDPKGPNRWGPSVHEALRGFCVPAKIFVVGNRRRDRLLLGSLRGSIPVSQIDFY